MSTYDLLSLLETKFRAGKMSGRMRRILGKLIARVDCQCGSFAASVLGRVENWIVSI